MNPSQKLKALGQHYKISGWEKLDWKEKLNAIKDRTGCDTLDKAYEKYLSDSGANTRVKASQPSAAKKDDAKDIEELEDVKSGEVISPSSTRTLFKPNTSMIVNVPTPSVVMNQKADWQTMLRVALMWVQTFALGFLAASYVNMRF